MQDGHYFQSYFLDLFYMQQWEDALWPMTVSRSYRSLSIMHLRQTPRLINGKSPHNTSQLETPPPQHLTSLFCLGCFCVCCYATVTMAAERVFSIVVGSFPPDVFFSYLSVGEQTVSWDEVPHFGFNLSEVPFPNGTHGYLLQIPFSHTLVSQKVRAEAVISL